MDLRVATAIALASAAFLFFGLSRYGVVNVDDLNNVILDWGTSGTAHGGDVTGPLPGSPPDGIVDVNDLNAVIVGWGVCGVGGGA